MTILHICWLDNQLAVWGEQPARLSGALPVVEDKGARPSPFDVGEDRLASILTELLWEKEEGVRIGSLSLALPTASTPQGEYPVPSQPFLCETADGELRPLSEAFPARLELWRVTAAHLSWRKAFALLGLASERRLADEVFAAEDLLVGADNFRYAGALVARGKFLPDLRRGSGSDFEAYWRPVIDGAEEQRVQALAARLPPVAACGRAPRRVTDELLEELTDRLVRFSVVTTLSRAQAERGKFYSAHDAWFSALRGERRTIRWHPASDLEALRESVRHWRRPVELGLTKGAAILFQLDEPDDAEKPWFLRVRIKRGEQTCAFSAEVGKPADGYCAGEHLLLSLGQAGMLFPPLARAEAQAGGFGCLLRADEAYAFLTTSSALLEASGYGVLLPAWWSKGKPHAVALRADVSPQAAGGRHTLEAKVDVNWTVTLNGEPLAPEELGQLLKAQTPLVFFRGQWIQVDVRQLQDALRVWQRKGVDTHSALDVVKLALGTAGHGGLDVAEVRGAGWLDPFLKRLRGEQTFEILPTPPLFCGELRPYQVRGFSWLAFLREWGFGACLADDMGLGKTIQALAFLLREKERGEKRPVLLVGPMSVLGNWLREAQRFAPALRCLLHHGAGRGHGDSFAREAQAVDLVITSYQLLYRDYTNLRKVRWAGILLDEAQNIKNPDTHQAQAARALQGDYRIALTGTPMENHVGDIWSIMDFLNPGLLGKRSVFREKFFRPIQSGTDPGARTRLKRVTMPFILRRLKTDKQIIADLPEKIEGKVYCPLTLEQARLYDEVLETFRRDVALSEGVQRRGLILAVLTRLKQVCNHPANYLGQTTAALARRSGKLTRLEEMLEETFACGESALVFTQYAEMGALLKRYLCQTFAREMPFLHGGVPRKERDRLVQSFQESPEPLAFILSLKAGGTGLNLTRASRVFHYDRWWNPAVEDQATDRAFRIGQTHNVMVHKFICGGTLEDRIDALIEHKTALASEIVTSGEEFLTELSDAELDEVLRLSETVVDEEGGA
mgnify:CR=1 FL=1